MTWTLRLNDNGGREIAWIQITDDGEYSYSVQQSKSEWTDFEFLLNQKRRIWADIDEAPVVSDAPFSLIQDPGRIEKTLTPEEHLSRIQDDLEDLPEVGTTELRDE